MLPWVWNKAAKATEGRKGYCQVCHLRLRILLASSHQRLGGTRRGTNGQSTCIYKWWEIGRGECQPDEEQGCSEPVSTSTQGHAPWERRWITLNISAFSKHLGEPLLAEDRLIMVGGLECVEVFCIFWVREINFSWFLLKPTSFSKITYHFN